LKISALFFTLFLLLTNTIAKEINTADRNNSTIYEEAEQKAKLLKERNILIAELNRLDERFPRDNIWMKKYNNFQTYNKLNSQKIDIEKELEELEKKNKKGGLTKDINDLQVRLDTLQKQLNILKEYKENPFSELTAIKQIDTPPSVDNPVAVVGALSFMRQLEQKKKEYEEYHIQLENILSHTEKRLDTLDALAKLDSAYAEELAETTLMLEEFRYAIDILDTAINIYTKRADEISATLKAQIGDQIVKSFYIFLIIAALFVISILIKLGNKKYISDNERLYTANKIVNFINVTLIILILLFSYLENVSYLVTLLGFASAGLAIAMKDLFMSLLGWLVIVFGGSIHVGDRIRVMKDGNIYLGDVLDISLLRITLHEDVTLTTYELNRRAGRIIFVPNNYVFTTLISNYSHSGMKTVWDGIDITVSFDSNIKKAMQITRDVARKYSKGYTDITRKQLNKLRDRYSLKNTGVDPRVFSLIEPNGVVISTWYLTNAFATLTLRSTISGEIVEEFMKHSDIKIAYPTNTINIKKNDPAMNHPDMKELVEKGLF